MNDLLLYLGQLWVVAEASRAVPTGQAAAVKNPTDGWLNRKSVFIVEGFGFVGRSPKKRGKRIDSVTRRRLLPSSPVRSHAFNRDMFTCMAFQCRPLTCASFRSIRVTRMFRWGSTVMIGLITHGLIMYLVLISPAGRVGQPDDGSTVWLLGTADAVQVSQDGVHAVFELTDMSGSVLVATAISHPESDSLTMIIGRKRQHSSRAIVVVADRQISLP